MNKILFSASTWQHLRLPFSFFLLPVFSFAVALASPVAWWRVWFALAVWHLLVYPASNGFNSYYDKDEGSIGGVERPMPVSAELLRASLLFDFLGSLLAFALGWQFGVATIIYGVVSKAYSHPAVRLKKYPILSLLSIGVFQGFWVFIFSVQALETATWERLFSPYILVPACLSGLMLLGSYPMTQVYQHQEDAKRNDLTMSRLLGIKGTFFYTAAVFAVATAGFVYYFWQYFGVQTALAYPVCLSPVLGFFFWWFWQVWQNPDNANFQRTMQLNLLSAISLNLFYVLLWWWR